MEVQKDYECKDKVQTLVDQIMDDTDLKYNYSGDFSSVQSNDDDSIYSLIDWITSK